MLTKNQRTHIIIFKDWRKINVTKTQAEFIEQELELKKHNEFITIDDIDTKQVLFKWRCSEIKEFQERNTDSSLANANAVCDFWWRHPIQWFPDNCTCAKDFDCMRFQFQFKLEEMWYKIEYASDITEEMRAAYKQQMKNI